MFKDTLLEGKRILVTGGGSGLGKEMASEYAKLGKWNNNFNLREFSKNRFNANFN